MRLKGDKPTPEPKQLISSKTYLAYVRNASLASSNRFLVNVCDVMLHHQQHKHNRCYLVATYKLKLGTKYHILTPDTDMLDFFLPISTYIVGFLGS